MSNINPDFYKGSRASEELVRITKESLDNLDGDYSDLKEELDNLINPQESKNLGEGLF